MQNTCTHASIPTIEPAMVCLTSLEYPETSVHASGCREQFPPDLDYRTIIRNRTNGEYDRAYKLYHLATGRLQSKHCKRLNMCGSAAMFMRHKETGEIKIASSACHLRFCPICAQRRSLEVTERILEWLGKKDVIRFITLTLQHSRLKLRDQLDNLVKAWRRLNKSDNWKAHVKSGVWVLQVTYNAETRSWHPHLHMLVRGSYYPQAQLSKDWLNASGNSYITDCRQVGSRKKAAEYIGRYVGRATTLDKIPESRYVDYYWGLNGKRLFGEFGTGKGDERLLAKVKRSDLDEWEQIGFYKDVVKSLSFDPDSKAIYNCWKKKEPLHKILKVPKRIVDYNLNGDITIWEFPAEGFFNAYTIRN